MVPWLWYLEKTAVLVSMVPRRFARGDSCSAGVHGALALLDGTVLICMCLWCPGFARGDSIAGAHGALSLSGFAWLYCECLLLLWWLLEPAVYTLAVVFAKCYEPFLINIFWTCFFIFPQLFLEQKKCSEHFHQMFPGHEQNVPETFGENGCDIHHDISFEVIQRK